MLSFPTHCATCGAAFTIMHECGKPAAPTGPLAIYHPGERGLVRIRVDDQLTFGWRTARRALRMLARLHGIQAHALRACPGDST